MPVVRVLPSGIEIEVEAGGTVFAAAAAAGIRWPTICGGQGSCRACVMQVVEGRDALGPIGRWEQEGLEESGLAGEVGGAPNRLACQAEVRGDAVVRRTGVRVNEQEG